MGALVYGHAPIQSNLNSSLQHCLHQNHRAINNQSLVPMVNIISIGNIRRRSPIQPSSVRPPKLRSDLKFTRIECIITITMIISLLKLYQRERFTCREVNQLTCIVFNNNINNLGTIMVAQVVTDTL
jgi:hypothetical protein